MRSNRSPEITRNDIKRLLLHYVYRKIGIHYDGNFLLPESYPRERIKKLNVLFFEKYYRRTL